MLRNKLFLSYHRSMADEIDQLATELRMRGIPVWLDRDEGLKLGDMQEPEVRRVLRNECFGALLYATPKAFDSTFITRVEMSEAIKMAAEVPEFALFAVPRRISFQDLSDLSTEALGRDLSLAASYEGLAHMPAAADVQVFLREHQELSTEVLAKWLSTDAARAASRDAVNILLDTWDRPPPCEGDTLVIDASDLRRHSVLRHKSSWCRLKAALQSVKERLRRYLPACRLRVRGHAHLSAGFLFGSAFRGVSGFELECLQGGEWWSSACCTDAGQGFLQSETRTGQVSSDSAHVLLSVTEKDVSVAHSKYVAQSGRKPRVVVSLRPATGLHASAVSDGVSCAIAASDVRSAIAQVTADHPEIKLVEVFASVPLALAIMVGHCLNATVPVQLHEHDGLDYFPSATLNERRS